MGLKKIALSIAVAVAALALSLPAIASALTLKDAGKEVNEQFLELSGTWAPKFLGASMDCRFRIRYTINLQVVKVTEFEVLEMSNCLGEGILEGCEVTESVVNGLPWTVDVDAKQLTITDFTQETTLAPEPEENCPIETFTIKFPTLIATVDNPKAIRRLSYDGKGFFNFGGEFEVETEEGEEFGSSEVEGETKGTYEIA